MDHMEGKIGVDRYHQAWKGEEEEAEEEEGEESPIISHRHRISKHVIYTAWLNTITTHHHQQEEKVRGRITSGFISVTRSHIPSFILIFKNNQRQPHGEQTTIKPMQIKNRGNWKFHWSKKWENQEIWGLNEGLKMPKKVCYVLEDMPDLFWLKKFFWFLPVSASNIGSKICHFYYNEEKKVNFCMIWRVLKIANFYSEKWQILLNKIY